MLRTTLSDSIDTMVQSAVLSNKNISVHMTEFPVQELSKLQLFVTRGVIDG